MRPSEEDARNNHYSIATYFGENDTIKESTSLVDTKQIIPFYRLLIMPHDISQKYYEFTLSKITNNIDTINLHINISGTATNFSYLGNYPFDYESNKYNIKIPSNNDKYTQRFYATNPPLQNLQAIRTYILGIILTLLVTHILKLIKRLFWD